MEVVTQTRILVELDLCDYYYLNNLSIFRNSRHLHYINVNINRIKDLIQTAVLVWDNNHFAACHGYA